ncbi:short chain dehydrogenase reductase [Lasiosphaeria miniovina]|uniref:Short chain dehydrogenase reductase n=1 Tax=Lasiosphaeria miniovina TaxID=1954250 RepID=A0AA40BHE8_9PEZI|nr:short chain dehydrogenase reductase [Lasiosphaeria miniovina]KAK0734281.1 short chain dehydrogenase reductase [Lasiosphaeria miniovina]
MAATRYTHVALVTGANQGLGFEIAKKLTTEHSDYRVIMAGRRKEAIDKAVAELQGAGLAVEGLQMDVTSDESITEAARVVRERHGRLDVLVNNAGVFLSEDGWPRKVFQETFDINVFGVARVTETFIPLLEKSEVTKRIVMMSSSTGSNARLTDPLNPKRSYWASSFAIYSTSKAALNMLANEYATRFENDPTWKVNLNCPGHCATNLNDFAGRDTPQNGAINACRLATLGPDGETGTFTDRNGVVPY